MFIETLLFIFTWILPVLVILGAGISFILFHESFFKGLLSSLLCIVLIFAFWGCATKSKQLEHDRLSKDPSYIECDGSYYKKTPILSADEENNIFVLAKKGDKYIITEDTEFGRHDTAIPIKYVYIKTENNLKEPYFFEAEYNIEIDHNRICIVLPNNYIEKEVKE